MKRKFILAASLFLGLQSNNLINAQQNNPVGICYVEVNNSNMLNVGSYTLQDSNKQLFDIAIIFAGNINYDTSKSRAYIANNNNVTKVLNNIETYVKPLQQKGIKVLLDILGNHQGAGLANFPNREAARDFALQIANTVYTYGLDGIDLDDEYAGYGNNGTGQPNDGSFVMFLQELKKAMPDKLITFYNIGPVINKQNFEGDKAGNYINYAWNPYYGAYNIPSVPPLDKTKLSPSAIWIKNSNTQSTSVTTLSNLATKSKNDGYGVFMWYDLKGTNSADYLSAGSNILYGENTKLSGDLYSWTEGVSCDPPLGLDTNNVTGTSAKLNWTSDASKTYNIDYKLASSNTWTSAASGYSGNNITVNNLSLNTDYDWRIQTNCSSSLTSTYLFAPRFNSGNGCATPSGLKSSSYLGNSTVLSWDSTATANYNLQYKKVSETSWTEVKNISANTYTLQNLAENTTYQWKIQLACSADIVSTYTAESAFNSGFKAVSSPGARSLSFNGSTNYLNAGQFNLSGNAVTLEGWVKVNAFKTAFPNISSVLGIEVGDNNSAMLRFGDGGLANNKLQFILSFGSSQVKLNSNSSFNTATWYHIAAVYDGTAMKMYINGVLDTSVNVTGNFTANGILYLARNYDNSRALNGSLDEFRVWKKALTDQEIKNNMCNVSPLTSGLEANWKMDEGTGIGALDATPNTHFATLINMSNSNWSTEVPCKELSTESIATNKENTAFPNPVKKGENIYFNIKENAELLLSDLSGKLVKKQSIQKHNNAVNTNDLSSGVYIYQIKSNANKTLSSGKVMVK